MNQERINQMLDELFADIGESEGAREQKEELRIHMTEQVTDYMAKGLSFDESFQKAKEDMGDLDELLNQFKNEVGGFEHEIDAFARNINELHKLKKLKKLKKIGRVQRRRKYTRRFTFLHKLASLTPFIWIAMGIAFGGWQVWLLGWMIIPVSFVLVEALQKKSLRKLVGITPFIWIFLGAMIPGWQIWAFGWIIIPAAGILFNKSDNPHFEVDVDIDLGDGSDDGSEEIPEDNEQDEDELSFAGEFEKADRRN